MKTKEYAPWKKNKIVFDPLREISQLNLDEPDEDHLDTTAQMMIVYSVDCSRYVNQFLNSLGNSHDNTYENG